MRHYEGGKPQKPYGEVFSLTKRLLDFLAPHKAEIRILLILVAVTSLLPLVVPRLIGIVFDKVILSQGVAESEKIKNLIFLVGLILVVELVILTFNRIKELRMQRTSELLVLQMRSRIFSHLQSLSLNYHQKHRVGGLASRVLDESKVLEDMFKGGFGTFLIAPISFIGIFAVMLTMNWKLTLLALLPIPFLYFVMAYFIRRLREVKRKAKEEGENLASYIHEALAAIGLTKVFGREDYEKGRFDDLASRVYKSNAALSEIVTRYYPLMTLTTSMALVIVLLFGGIYSIRGYMSGGDVVAFIAYLSLFYSPLTAITLVNYILQNIAISAERIFEVLDEKPEITDGTNTIKGDLDIEFCSIGFSYEVERKILENVNLTIPFGDKIGIIGETGAGKSTLANLISRLYDASSGGIKIAGEDIRNIKVSALREVIAVVPQDDLLFCDSIKNNLLYGNLNASDGEIIKVLELANATDVIKKLPNGIDTIVGEKGATLSQGERQRICIARALIKRPKILILDEATSALDTETEKNVLDAIFETLSESTIVIISHRQSALSRCERIYEVTNGKVVEFRTSVV